MANDDDVWSRIMFSARFGGLPIDVITTRDTFRRAIIRHEYPRRDGAELDDEGALAREVDCLLIFSDPRKALPDDPPDWIGLNHRERFERFVKVANAGKAREFVHPLYGSFPARCESFEASSAGENRDQISVQAKFVEDGLNPVALTATIAKPIEGGAAAVDVEAKAASSAAAALPAGDGELVTDTATSAAEEVARWDANPDIDPNEVTTGLQRISDDIDTTIRRLDLLSTPNGYPTYRALARLHAQVRRAAERARRDAPALIQITTAAASPLRVLLADVFGAAGADAHMAEAIRLNRIPDPTLVEAGTVLTLPTPTPVGTQGTRRVGPAYAR